MLLFVIFKLNLREKALLGSAINQVTKRGHVELTNNIFRLKTNFDIRKNAICVKKRKRRKNANINESMTILFDLANQFGFSNFRNNKLNGTKTSKNQQFI
jgi:hypothetical protein